MHRDLKELLGRAKGESDLVVVVFLDVRGFSSFAKLAESSESALFLTSTYLRILNDYFPDAAFFKPTGDGLLIVLDFDKDSLTTVVRRAVDRSIALVADFATICADDPMVNFEVPDKLGIGLARGAATRLVADDRTLDYSGRPLNLAARLMDLARPAGVIFDASLGPGLLEPEILGLFTEQQVYVKGIADDAPLTAYAITGLTRIPETNRRPLNKVRRVLDKQRMAFQELMDRNAFLHPLKGVPVDLDDIVVTVDYPKITRNGDRKLDMTTVLLVEPVKYLERQGAHWARVDYRPVTRRLAALGVRPEWEVTTLVEYSLPDDGTPET